jgi:hypothetical protein
MYGPTGVLTFHRCINYGSYWQAHCLVQALRARGLNAVLLDHRSEEVDRAEWKCAFRPTLPTPVPPEDRAPYRNKIEKFARAWCKLPLSPPFPLERPENLRPLRQVVIGSDEVWNFSHPWYASLPLFFGRDLPTDRVISYAASFGNYGHQWGLHEPFRHWLTELNAISVRDENSRTLIREGCGRDPALVLDPCLQFPLTPTGPWRGPDGDYLALYGHNFTEAFLRKVRRFAADRRLPVISIGYRNPGTEANWLEAGPEDFAHIMARAKAVATNFFHGCIFALRNHKPFVCELTPYRSHKVEGLMQAVQAEDHLLEPEAAQDRFEAALGQTPRDGIFEQIARLRRQSNAYLEAALI